MRVLYGLGRLPRGLATHDVRLPHVLLGPGKLRLNSDKLPPASQPTDLAGHAGRIAAARSWLHAACGDYGQAARGFIDAYLGFVAAELERHRVELTAGLAPYAGLYASEDWTWSALRPLPRAWVASAEGWQPVGVAFWTGERLLATGAPAGLRGVTALATDMQDPPPAMRRFWEGEILPATPFGRALPEALPPAGQAVISST